MIRFMLLFPTLFLSCSSMRPNGGDFVASLTPSTSSLESIEHNFMGCAELERKYLSNLIRIDNFRMASRAADNLLKKDNDADERFQQYFLSRYPNHKNDVKAWFWQFLHLTALTEMVTFQIQCHGERDQCYEDIYAVTDFERKAIVLCPLFWNDLPSRPPKRPLYLSDSPSRPRSGGNILSDRKYVTLLLLLEISRLKDPDESQSVSQFRISDPGNSGFTSPPTPWLAIQDPWAMVHFTRGVCDNEPPHNVNQLAPYNVPKGMDVVEDEYIVVLKKAADFDAHLNWIGVDLEARKYRLRRLSAINGYRAHLPRNLIQGLIRCDPRVAYIDPNVYLVQEPFEPLRPVTRQGSPGTSKAKRWQANIDLSTMQWWNKMIIAGRKIRTWITYPGTYLSDSGKGVMVYVFDSGVRITHHQFRRRATHFSPPDERSPYFAAAEPLDDRAGHGTMVAGIVQQNARESQIISVKVFRETQTRTTLFRLNDAIDDVVLEHRHNRISNLAGWRGSVINMSFGLASNTPPSFRRSIQAAYDEGIPVATSAGNGGAVSDQVPCRYSDLVICVAACKKGYQRWTGSNYGRDIRIFAPGHEVVAGDNRSDEDESQVSGTSFAAPAVAAALAIWVSFEKITGDTRQVYDRLYANQLQNAITSMPPASGTTSRLVNTGLHNPNKHPDQPYLLAPNAPAP